LKLLETTKIAKPLHFVYDTVLEKKKKYNNRFVEHEKMKILNKTMKGNKNVLGF